MNIKKSAQVIAHSCEWNENTKTLLAQYSKAPLDESNTYIFTVKLCDNEIDRDYEMFTIDCLRSLAELMNGRTGIFDHNPKAENQKSRLYACEVVTDPGKQNSLGQPYTYLRGQAYMLKNAENAALIDEIEAGIKKEASISCNADVHTCSVCGKDNRSCGHIRGRKYDGKKCFVKLENPTDVYEWSFVAIPAQREAGVMKNYKGGTKLENIIKSIKEGNLSEAEASDVTVGSTDALELSALIADLREQAQLGETYKSNLRREVTRLACFSQPHFTVELMEAVCKKLSVNELETMEKALKTAVSQKSLPQPQTAKQVKRETESKLTDGFKI